MERVGLFQTNNKKIKRMNFIDYLRRMKSSLLVRIHIAKEALNFYQLTIKYNASVKTNKDIEKMQYTLLRHTHTIEKGMSLRNPRLGFGQSKVLNLLDQLIKYADDFKANHDAFLDYPLSVINEYIRYTKNNKVEIPNIEKKYNGLLNMLDSKCNTSKASGVYLESKEHVLSLCNSDFKNLLLSRHSIRYFDDKIVLRSDIEEALRLAQQTPSACNRQGWKTHIFCGDSSHNLIKWQGGCRGFEEEIHTSVLVTANLKAFLSYEVHQAYVDGGLYAMNLINAFHSLGIGSIPLSTAFYCEHLAHLAEFGIPQNEVPILIIGIGYYLDEFKVAVSERKNINETNTYHK